MERFDDHKEHLEKTKEGLGHSNDSLPTAKIVRH